MFRKKWLIDCEAAQEFNKGYNFFAITWPKEFSKWMEKKQFTIGKCMLTEVGVATGFGNPPNTWVNNKME